MNVNNKISCREYSFAEWEESNGQKYLVINAQNYYEFGLLRGLCLKNQIKTTNRILKSFLKAYNLSFEQFLFFARKYNIPDNYNAEIQGLVDGTGLTYEKILIQKLWIDIYYGILHPLMTNIENIGACTSFTVRNMEEQLVHGQTMDLGFIFLPTLNWIKFKISGKQSVFCLNIGCGTLPIGKNHDVNSTINLVQIWITGNYGIPTSLKAQIAFESCRKSKNFQTEMTSSYCCGLNYIISDKKSSVIASETLSSMAINQELNKPGYVVKTNTYRNQQLKVYLLDPLYSIARQEKAEFLIKTKLNENNGFQIADGMKIMRYNDNTEASICRFSDPNDFLKVCTEAYFLTNGRKVFFGIGNPAKDSWGQIQL